MTAVLSDVLTGPPKTHVGDGRVARVYLLLLHRDEVDARHDAGPRSVPGTIQHTDGDEPYLLRHTVGRSADNAADMASVTVAVPAVLSVAEGVETQEGTRSPG